MPSLSKPLSLYISPCPNDTFAFYGLIHGAVDCEGLSCRVAMEDIDCLNQRAQAGEGDVIKISCANLPLLKENYTLLRSGSALGHGNGPLLVSKHKIYHDELSDAVVAVPGMQTTAKLLMDRTLPTPKEVRSYLFSDIAAAVADGEVDAGVLIHEGRFTFKKSGLQLIADLGELWEKQTGLPIPLGCIVANNTLGEDVIATVERTIRRSVEFAMANPAVTMDFVRSHARELEPDVLQKHISYFVNEYTVDLGDRGFEAVRMLLEGK